jgi:hypothetical protein
MGVRGPFPRTTARDVGGAPLSIREEDLQPRHARQHDQSSKRAANDRLASGARVDASSVVISLITRRLTLSGSWTKSKSGLPARQTLQRPLANGELTRPGAMMRLPGGCDSFDDSGMVVRQGAVGAGRCTAKERGQPLAAARSVQMA